MKSFSQCRVSSDMTLYLYTDRYRLANERVGIDMTLT